ncbi:MAG: peptidoglycan bridge formation glycyltransferase FemA/FemB family protein, partial [Spirochaetales bacterium]
MKVKPIPVRWQPGMSIFASESFLKAVGDEYGWLGGVSETGELLCILPYTLIRKMFLRMVRFRTETIIISEKLEILEEKKFLEEAMRYFRTRGADLIIPASNNAIFRTYPAGGKAAPYGSYIIDLNKTEEQLWKNIDRITRQNIKTAQKNGVQIVTDFDRLNDVHRHVRDTFRRSKLPFMNLDSFERYIKGLGPNGIILAAIYNGVVQSCVVFAFSEYCAYAIYAGNSPDQYPGANKLLYWEAIRLFRSMGVRRYDFMGARIDPEKGSKQEALAQFKKRFGAELKRGFMWKY